MLKIPFALFVSFFAATPHLLPLPNPAVTLTFAMDVEIMVGTQTTKSGEYEQTQPMQPLSKKSEFENFEAYADRL